MGDAKRRKALGFEPDLKSPEEKEKSRVMKRAASELLRPEFLRDLGRELASQGHEEIHCCIPAVSEYHYRSLPLQTGVAMQIVPSESIYSLSPPRYCFGPIHILTVECLSSEKPETIAEYVKEQLVKGVVLKVGYDRAYQGSLEYVVPLILEYVNE